MFSFTGALKTPVLLFQKKILNQTKVVNEDTEGITRAFCCTQMPKWSPTFC